MMSCALSGSLPGDSQCLTGVIVDTSSKTPVEGALVRVIELGRKARSDDEGRFKFPGMPQGDFTLCVHRAGYGAEHLLVNVPDSGDIRVALVPGYQFQDEITVSATPWVDEPLRIPQQIDVLDDSRIRVSSDGSVARLAGSVPGVRTAYTGDSASKPVIRGLTGNRIRVLNDGFPTSDQQFGIRHQPNVEALGTERVEIVRGPASVLFGANAMGGVVNLIQPPLPTAEGARAVVHGELYGGYAGNTDGGTGYMRLEGAVGGFGWRGSLIRRSFGDIHTPTARLDNTDFDQTNGDVTIGFTGSRGSARIRWNHWQNNLGFFRPKDFRVDLNNDLIAVDTFVPTKVGNFEFALGYQNNIRKAFPAALGGKPSVHLDLDNTVFDARFHHRRSGVLRGSIAVQIVAEENTPLALGELLPKYENDSWAVSLFEQAGWEAGGLEDRWLLSCALRYDNKNLEVPPDPSRDLPEGYLADWDSVTASVGLLYRLNEQFSLAGSLGKGWRAPSEFELFVEGIHGGVGAIQIGDPNLKEEKNLNSELSLRWRASRTGGYVNLFNNDFDNYIYLANTGEIVADLPVFKYRQTDAYLRGMDTSFELFLAEWFKTSAGFEYLSTENKSTGHKLPLTPPARFIWRSRLEDKPRGNLDGTYAEMNLSWCAEGKIAGPEEPFPYDTDSYTVLGLAAGTVLSLSEDISLGIDLLIYNLLNTEYRDFLYTYKGVADMPGRDVRLIARLRF